MCYKYFIPVKGHYWQYFPLPAPFPSTSKNVLLVWPDNFGGFQWLHVKSPKSRQKTAGNAERQRNVSLSHKEKVHSQFLHVQNVLFFLNFVFVPSGTKKAPTITGCNKCCSFSSLSSYSAWSAGFISQETQSAWKKKFSCRLQLLCTGCWRCLCVTGSFWLLLGHRQPLWTTATGSLTLEVSASSRAPVAPHWPGHRGHVVSREDTRGSCSQGCAFEPPILTLLRHPIHLAFPEFKFVGLLGLVGVQSQISEDREEHEILSLNSKTIASLPISYVK